MYQGLRDPSAKEAFLLCMAGALHSTYDLYETTLHSGRIQETLRLYFCLFGFVVFLARVLFVFVFLDGCYVFFRL